MSDSPDPVHASDRGTGSTPPETAAESANVVGRPADGGAAGFRAPEETADADRRRFSGDAALRDGGSFDGLGVPTADDPG